MTTKPPQNQSTGDLLQTAIALYRQGHLAEARSAGLSVKQAIPNNFIVLQLLGLISAQSGEYEDALAYFDSALRQQPETAEAHYNRGTALADLNRYGEALECFETALQFKPHFPEAHNNCGEALRELNRVTEAIRSFTRAQELRPDYATAHWNEGLCRLLLGDFHTGWNKFEWRWKKIPESRFLRHFEQPLWLGKENIAGKSILLHAEQGLGDTLQFCRYAAQVANKGARVILEVQPALCSVLKELDGISELIGHGSELPAFDFHCPLLSLPLALGIDSTNISGAPYLRAEKERLATWKARLGSSENTCAGIVWSGNPHHQNDANRSIPFATFRSIFETSDTTFYCLQKELREGNSPVSGEFSALRMLDLKFAEFSDTAALVDLMDVVITVDTSVAHLAGAMGKTVWLLLPYAPDWRWMLSRSDTLWYRSMTLFRQPRPGDWESVLAAVRLALSQLSPPQR